MTSEKVKTAKILIHFLSNLFERRKKINREGENMSLFIIDNASILKLQMLSNLLIRDH